MTQVAHQENYPYPSETVGAARQRDERGSMHFSGRGIAAITVLALGGYFAANAYGYGAEDGNSGVEIAKGAHVDVKLVALEPMDVQCDAIAGYLVNGGLPYRKVIADKELPFGVDVTVTNTLVADSFCPTGDDKTPPTVIRKVPGKIVNGYQLMQVIMDTGTIKQNVQFVEETKDFEVTDSTAMKLGGGLLSVAGGGASTVCNTATIGKQQKACYEFGNNFTGWADKLRKNADHSAELTVLQLVREQAVGDWEAVKKTIIDSYKQQAIRDAGGDPKAADAVEVIFTGPATPDPNNDYLDILKKKDLVSEKDAKVDTSKIKITKQPPAENKETNS